MPEGFKIEMPQTLEEAYSVLKIDDSIKNDINAIKNKCKLTISTIKQSYEKKPFKGNPFWESRRSLYIEQVETACKIIERNVRP